MSFSNCRTKKVAKEEAERTAGVLGQFAFGFLSGGKDLAVAYTLEEFPRTSHEAVLLLRCGH